MSIDSLKYNLEEYLGKNIRSDEVQDLLDYICNKDLKKIYTKANDETTFEGSIEYTNYGKGLSVTINEEKQVVMLIGVFSENLFFCDDESLYASEFRDDDVLRQFKGPLPLNIKFTDSRQDIIKKNGNTKEANLLLTYDNEKIIYEISFDENDEFIEKIQLYDKKIFFGSCKEGLFDQ